MHIFLVFACQSKDFAQVQKKFALSQDRETVTFRNSALTKHYFNSSFFNLLWRWTFLLLPAHFACSLVSRSDWHPAAAVFRNNRGVVGNSRRRTYRQFASITWNGGRDNHRIFMCSIFQNYLLLKIYICNTL